MNAQMPYRPTAQDALAVVKKMAEDWLSTYAPGTLHGTCAQGMVYAQIAIQNLLDGKEPFPAPTGPGVSPSALA